MVPAVDAAITPGSHRCPRAAKAAAVISALSPGSGSPRFSAATSRATMRYPYSFMRWPTGTTGLLGQTDVAARETAFLEVPLVVLFRRVERHGRHDLRDDRPAELVCGLERVARGDRGRVLRFVMIENRRPILRADVRPLPVQRRRVVVLPENIQQVIIRDLGRVIGDL